MNKIDYKSAYETVLIANGMLRQENKELQEKYNIRSKAYNNILLENADLHNKIDKAIGFIDIYTNGINLEGFDCLKLMYKIKDLLKDSDVDENR